MEQASFAMATDPRIVTSALETAERVLAGGARSPSPDEVACLLRSLAMLCRHSHGLLAEIIPMAQAGHLRDLDAERDFAESRHVAQAVALLEMLSGRAEVGPDLPWRKPKR